MNEERKQKESRKKAAKKAIEKYVNLHNCVTSFPLPMNTNNTYRPFRYRV
jgi:hypothetical protein